MNDTTTAPQTSSVITHADLLKHWQGHRNLTRRLIEVFPEKEFFAFSIGGMRTAAALMKELLSIAAPGICEMATGTTKKLEHELDPQQTKAHLLKQWDEATDEINQYWAMIPVERFHDDILAFGMYPGKVWSSIMYFIDNEIHHRAQAYVYLRALGIEPPAFYER